MSICARFLLLTALSLGTAFAQEAPVIKPDHPDRYTVVKDDTLWDISARFLRDPWRWPEVWRNNPDIKNPHLIYPSDVIFLVYRDGKPMLTIQRGGVASSDDGQRLPVTKLSPQARPTRLSSAIATIPASAIRQLLMQPRVLTEEEVQAAGHIVAFDSERLISGNGNKAYARRLAPSVNNRYGIYRIGNPYRSATDPKDILGYEAIRVAEADLTREGDPATLTLTHAYRETLRSDRVLPLEAQEVDYNFMPQAPAQPVRGQVIAILDGVSSAGRYQIVTLNLGARDGLKRGDVLAVNQAGITVTDSNVADPKQRDVTLPEERAGLVMVYSVFDRVSYALIMNAERHIHRDDIVTNP